MAQTSAYARFFSLLAFSMLWLLSASSAHAQGTAFTYQGKLTDAGNPANNTYDLQFKLFDTPGVGTGAQQGSTLTNPTVQLTAGIFVVTLDFNQTVFSGALRFLEIGVRPWKSQCVHSAFAAPGNHVFALCHSNNQRAATRKIAGEPLRTARRQRQRRHRDEQSRRKTLGRQPGCA